MTDRELADLLDQLWAAEVKLRNAGGHVPMTPEANFRNGAEAALRLLSDVNRPLKRVAQGE